MGDFQHGFKSTGQVSAHGKKWVSAAAVADLGNSQALFLKPDRSPQFGPSFHIAFTKATLWNYSGGNATVGLAVRYATRYWQAGQVTVAGVYTDDTEDAQDAGTSDFAIHAGAESGSGFLLSCDEPFNIFSLIMALAGDQVTPVFISEYWNGATWSDNTTAYHLANTLIADGATEKVCCFALPQDWKRGGSGVGVPGRYNLRIRHTNGGAGAEVATASQIFLGLAKWVLVDLQDDSNYAIEPDPQGPTRFPIHGEALFPLFSTAHLQNSVEARIGVTDIYSD